VAPSDPNEPGFVPTLKTAPALVFPARALAERGRRGLPTPRLRLDPRRRHGARSALGNAHESLGRSDDRHPLVRHGHSPQTPRTLPGLLQSRRKRQGAPRGTGRARSKDFTRAIELKPRDTPRRTYLRGWSPLSQAIADRLPIAERPAPTLSSSSSPDASNGPYMAILGALGRAGAVGREAEAASFPGDEALRKGGTRRRGLRQFHPLSEATRSRRRSCLTPRMTSRQRTERPHLPWHRAGSKPGDVRHPRSPTCAGVRESRCQAAPRAGRPRPGPPLLRIEALSAPSGSPVRPTSDGDERARTGLVFFTPRSLAVRGKGNDRPQRQGCRKYPPWRVKKS